MILGVTSGPETPEERLKYTTFALQFLSPIFKLKSSKAEPSFFSRSESHIPHQIATLKHTFEKKNAVSKTSDFW